MFISTSANSVRLVCLFYVLVSLLGAIQSSMAQTSDEEYGIAAGHYERQEYEVAIEKFRELIQQKPSTKEAAISYFFLGESHVQLGDYSSAYPAYQIYLKRLPEDRYVERAQFRLAECAFQLQWDDLAAKHLEQFVEERDDSELLEYGLTYLGELRLRRKEPQLAFRVFNRAIDEYPASENSARNRLGLARSLQALGQVDEATRIYELLQNSGNQSMAARATMQLGVIRFQNSEYKQADELLAESVDRLANDPYLVEAQFWLARAKMELDEYKSAFRFLNRAKRQANNEELKSAIIYHGAVAAAKSGRDKICLEWLEQLDQTWPNSQWVDNALLLQIEVNFRQQQFEEAANCINRYRQRFAENAQLPLVAEYEARVAYELKQYAEAIRIVDELLAGSDSIAITPAKKYDWLYLKSLAFIGQKDFQSALATLKLISEMPQAVAGDLNSSVLLATATCHVATKNFESAINALKRFLATEPSGQTAVTARADLIIAYAKTGDWEMARTELDNAKAASSSLESLLEAELLLGELALQHDRYSLAQHCFQNLSNPANPRSLTVRGISGLAWIQMKRGDEKSAIDFFQQIVDEYGETPLAGESALACGKYFEQQGRYSDAQKMYEAIEQQFTNSEELVALARIRIAFCLSKQAGAENVETAKRILKQAIIQNSPLADQALYQLAWIHLEAGDQESAIASFETIRERHPDSKFWSDSVYRIADHRTTENRFDDVSELLDQLERVDLGPEISDRVKFLRGRLEIHDQNWLQVQTIMSSVLNTSDDGSLRMHARYWLAESRFQAGLFSKALEEFKELEKARNEAIEHQAAWTALRMAQCQAALEDWSIAFKQAQKGRSSFPEFEAAHEFDFVIGRAHAALGRLNEARAAFKRVTESEHGKTTETAAMAQWQIGQTYFHQQNFERAIEAFYRVDALYAYDNWRSAALVEAGKCHEHLGNWNHAVRLYQQSIAKFPNSQFAVVAKQRLAMASRQAKRQIITSNKK